MAQAIKSGTAVIYLAEQAFGLVELRAQCIRYVRRSHELLSCSSALSRLKHPIDRQSHQCSFDNVSFDRCGQHVAVATVQAKFELTTYQGL